MATYQAYVAELALWERRWTDADEAVRDGMAWARPARGRAAPRLVVRQGPARAGGAGGARARPPGGCGGARCARRAADLLAAARGAAADAASITPNAEGWLALAEAEDARARGNSAVDLWSGAAAVWDRVERPPLAAYCRWREAEALVAAGASRVAAAEPLRAAYAVAARLAAEPLRREIDLLAQRARLDLEPPAPAEAAHGFEDTLGLTHREAEVLSLLARGYTNREIAATLVISVKTASVHVSHILGKLRVPNRREAAAVAHRLAPPPVGRGDDA